VGDDSDEHDAGSELYKPSRMLAASLNSLDKHVGVSLLIESGEHRGVVEATA
jgi:hypothetical protein